MTRRTPAVVVAALTLVGGTMLFARARPSAPATDDCSRYDPPLPAPSHFVSAIDNPYFPLPVGRTLVYHGVEDGNKEIDRVQVTNRSKLIEGIPATVVNDDVLKRGGTLLEKTFDYYGQDDQGNVWYLGENTKEFKPNGTVDTSGSWESGVNSGKPGIVMEADPRVPDAYRQECLTGQAQDLAWVVGRGGDVKVPWGRTHRVLRTLEFSPLEPGVVDRKFYGPGLGIIAEKQMSGGQEVWALVHVTG
jgi:hypothetical protein